MMMTTTAYICSVPHTGTMFIWSLLKNSGIDSYWKHFVSFRGWKLPTTDEIMVCPIRHPIQVWHTWENRHTAKPGTYDFAACWYRFNDAFKWHLPSELFVIPVDTPDRDVHLKRLSDRLGCTLHTDWKPVSSQPHSRDDGIFPSELLNILQLDVVQTFYGATT
jgi:hypothetical protein